MRIDARLSRDIRQTEMPDEYRLDMSAVSSYLHHLPRLELESSS